MGGKGPNWMSFQVEASSDEGFYQDGDISVRFHHQHMSKPVGEAQFSTTAIQYLLLILGDHCLFTSFQKTVQGFEFVPVCGPSFSIRLAIRFGQKLGEKGG